MTDYIDREALKYELKDHYMPTDQRYEEERQWAIGYNAGLNRALYSIAYAHAADVAPVRLMDWVPIKDLFVTMASKEKSYSGNVTYCSACGEQNPNAYKTPYCPICGAKWRGINND